MNSEGVSNENYLRFLIKLAQEIQRPLTEIAGFSELVSNEVVGANRRRATAINENAVRVVNALRATLDLVRLRTGAFDPEPELLDLSGQAREVVESFRPKIRSRGLWLEFEGTDAKLDVMIDRTSVRTVLEELLSNAVAFTQKGGITVSTYRSDSWAVVDVRDTGKGIGSSFLPRIFDEFTREEEPQPSNGSGVGLGLAIAKRLVELFDGRLTAENQQGGGTTFSVRFPIVIDGVVQVGAGLPAKDIETIEEPSKPVLLMVEDNAVTRKVMTMILRDSYRIVEAETVDEAFERARGNHLDLLLLDIALNDRRTGVEVLHGIRSMPEHANIPAVVCTAYSLPGLRDRYLDAGFDGYIAKPFRKEQLLGALDLVTKIGVHTERKARPSESVNVEIPPLPNLLARILTVVSADERSTESGELSQLLGRDPALASWVLDHIHSAFYDVRGEAEDVEQAIALLGPEPVCNLALIRLLSQAFSIAEGDRPRAVFDRLLKTAVESAVVARELANHIPEGNAETAFTAGILHDVGRLCLLRNRPEKYIPLWYETQQIAAPTVGKELVNLGVDHVSAGVEVARAWKMAEKFASVIRHVEEPHESSVEHRSLVLIVASGRALATASILDGDSAEKGDAESLLRALETFHDVDGGELLSSVTEKRDEIRGFVDRMTGPLQP